MNDRDSGGGVAGPVNETLRREKRQHPKPKRQPRYNVVLWNDDDHTYSYVITMLMQLLGYTQERGFQLAEEVDHRGKAILLTTTLEHAELKRDQIHAFGSDGEVDGCRGSMWASVESVDG